MEKILKVCWLPFIQFRKLRDKLCELYKSQCVLKNNVHNNLKVIFIQFSECEKIIIDSLGYIYYEISASKEKSNHQDTIIENIISSMSEKNKDFLRLTIFNPTLKDNKKNPNNPKEQFQKEFKDFIKKMFENNVFTKNSIENISLELLKYKIKKSNSNTSIKLSTNAQNNDNDNLYNIINRNITKLLEKSLFFTKDLKFEEYEIYDLDIINSSNIRKIIEQTVNLIKIYRYEENNYNLNLIGNDKTREIATNLIKKAIQDSIEEKVILSFLREAKNEYIVKIYDNIHKINEAIKNKSSTLLSVISHNENNLTEEDIELFIHQLLQSLPHFKAIDNKIKKAYYIKIGNTTTYTQIHQEETIEYTIDYQNWKNAIIYFENMAFEIENSLSIFHQNKSLKELENISYFQNYQTDIDDLKNIQSTKEPLHEDTKSYINRVTLFITTMTLAASSPLIKLLDKNTSIIKSIDINSSANGENTSNFNLDYTLFLPQLGEIIINSVIYSIIILLLYLLYKKTVILKEKNKNFYTFDKSDFDKHEHRSIKPILTYENNELQRKTISYNDLYTAYNLIDKLKNTIISYKNGYKIKLFPELLNEPPTNIDSDIKIRETYRVSRQDKVTTQIMLRYKVFDLKIDSFLKFIQQETTQKDNNQYINFLKEIEKNTNTGHRKIEEHEKNLQILKDKYNKEISLTLYIVYSFNLRLKKFKNENNENEYIYEIFKDHFRVHYHINKLPTKNIKYYQSAIAEFIYFYFIARFKNFHKTIERF